MWMASRAFILTLLVLFCLPVSGQDEDEAWLEDDSEQRAREVNEGVLRFLPVPPAQPVHHYINRIRIHAGSLRDGWIGLEQCHEHLDAVPRAEVTFSPERIRKLRVLSAEGIGRAWVEGASVQLEAVAPGAGLCIAAESRALAALPGGRYLLRNGPYMRRFLDGYYPMHVSMQIELEVAGLEWEAVRPAPQPGFALSRRGRQVAIEAWFEGRLFTENYFRLR